LRHKTQKYNLNKTHQEAAAQEKETATQTKTQTAQAETIKTMESKKQQEKSGS
jgi:hypothetical protein